MSRLKDNRFIAPDAVTGDSVRLDNDQGLKARNAADSADVELIKVDAFDRTILTGAAGQSILFDKSFLPALDNTYSSGLVNVAWSDVASRKFSVSEGSSIGELNPAATSPSGATNSLSFLTTGTKDMSIFTANSAVADAAATKPIRVETGNKSAGTGDSGAIYATTGTSVGGDRGKIELDALTLRLASEMPISGGFGGGQVDIARVSAAGRIHFGNGSAAMRASAELAPETDGNIELGNINLRWQAVHSDDFCSDGGSFKIQTIPSGVASVFSVGSSNIVDAGLFTGNNVDADAINTQSVYIETGNKSNAGATGDTGTVEIKTGDAAGSAGDSGSISVETGTSANGTRGSITLNAANVLTSSAIEPSGDATLNNGGFFANWAQVYSRNFTSNTGNMTVGSNINTTFTAIFGTGSLSSASASGLATVKSGENTGAGDTGGVLIKSGDSTSAASGSVTLESGAAGTTRGTIDFKDGSEGTIGHVWTSTGVNGEGNWAAPGGLTADSVTSTEILLDNNTFLRWKDDPGGTPVNVLRLNPSERLELGSSVFSFSPQSNGGADLGLSTQRWNLLSVNQIQAYSSILPDVDGGADIGATGNRFNFLFSKSAFIGSGAGAGLRMVSAQTLPSGATAANIRAEAAEHLGLTTIDQAITKDVYVETGNASGGNSGKIDIQTGTATGTRGKIRLRDGSEGTVGHAWISSDIDGGGNWAAIPVTGADQQLSNLSGTTTVPVDILPLNSAVTDLGSATKRWAEVHATTGVFSNIQPKISGNSALILKTIDTTATGPITANSGNASAGASGAMAFKSGSGTTATGATVLQTGNASAGTSGDINLQTGTATGDSGSIFLDTGDSSGGTDGNIDLQAGTGQVIIVGSSVDFADSITENVTWKADTTGNRPGLPSTGARFFDTTLGIPIWYDGANWVDATGTTV